MSMRVGTVVWIAALVLTGAQGASAKPGFGENVDAYCSAQGRGTPYADLSGQGFLSECGLCHQFVFPPETPDGGNTFDPPAQDYLDNRRSGNFSAFCPAATNQPPVIAAIADRSVNVGQMLVIDVSASDADGDGIALSVANAPAGASFADHGDGTGTFTWTPGAADLGTRTVNFLAQDDAVPPGQALEAVAITVGSANRPPVLGAIGSRTGEPGALLQIAVSARDQDGDAIELTAEPLPQGATFADAGDGSGLFAWTPGAAQVGRHSVTFRASDDGTPSASDSESVTLTIGAVNAPPVLAPIGRRSTRVGQPLHVAIHATDADGDALAFTATGLPDGAAFTDAGDGSAALDWTPAAADAGTYLVTVTVSDDGAPSESDSERFELVVEPEAAPSDAHIDDARWLDRRHDGRLQVRGSGAKPREMVAVLDASTGLVLASRKANRHGGFRLEVEPMTPPCAVQLQAADLRSDPVPVRGAPATCDAEQEPRVRARWHCGEPEEDDDEGGEASLHVHGERVPAGARVDARDADSAAALGSTYADERGRFSLRVPLAAPPRAVAARLAAGELEWTVGPIPVSVDCDDDEDGDDDEDEDDARGPKKGRRSDDE
jgi:hypothetical protein